MSFYENMSEHPIPCPEPVEGNDILIVPSPLGERVRAAPSMGSGQVLIRSISSDYFPSPCGRG